jgi:hypothetical protein
MLDGNNLILDIVILLATSFFIWQLMDFAEGILWGCLMLLLWLNNLGFPWPEKIAIVSAYCIFGVYILSKVGKRKSVHLFFYYSRVFNRGGRRFFCGRACL